MYFQIKIYVCFFMYTYAEYSDIKQAFCKQNIVIKNTKIAVSNIKICVKIFIEKVHLKVDGFTL